MYTNYIGTTIYIDKHWESSARDPKSLILLSEAIMRDGYLVKNKRGYRIVDLEKNNKDIVKYTLKDHLNTLKIVKL